MSSPLLRLVITVTGLNKLCARHGAVLGGESPLYAVDIGNTSLGKGVHREVESEGS